MPKLIELSRSPKSVLKDYLYKDTTFTMSLTHTMRDLEPNTDGKAIQNSLTNIFTFRKGERILEPEFGSNLYEFLYEPINDILLQKIGQEAITMIERWEPRVEVIDVVVTPYYDTNTVHLTLKYAIPSLNNDTLEMELAISARK